MTWTYSGDPDGERKDEVRFLVGDTDTNAKLVQDEEIEFVLKQYPAASGKPAWLAAAHVCDAIAGKFARKINQSVGPLSASNEQQYEHYVALAQQLRVLHATNGKGVIAGSMAGITPATPRLSGGGKTYLGSSSYLNLGDR